MDLTKMKYYVVVPQAAINYVKNPTPYMTMAGYTAFGGANIAFSTISGRRGPRCVEVTPSVDLSGIYYSTISVTNGETYTFSVDVKGEAGKEMRLRVADAGGTHVYDTEFTATGYWQRVSVEFTAEETEDDYWLCVLRDATTGVAPFYVDGFQFEEGEATTFFSGDTKGFGIDAREFYWAGEPHNSISYRTADTRAGGRLLDISEYARILSATGLGFGEFNQLFTELAGGGAFYQKHIVKPRNFSLILTYSGDNPGELQASRNAILEAVTPDLTGYAQPMILRYQGLDDNGDEASEPLDIVCVFSASHKNTPQYPVYQKDILSFIALGGYLEGAYKEGLELGLRNLINTDSRALYRDKTGLWHDIANDGVGISTLDVRCLVEAPNGDVIIGGEFNNAGGIPEADYICVWNGEEITSLTGAEDFNWTVSALCYDAEGNLIIGGSFTGAGGVNGNRIVKWNGTTLSAFGLGIVTGECMAIAIEPSTGDIYIGGGFTNVGNVQDTYCIAYWDVSEGKWKAVGEGLNYLVWTLKFAPNGDLYIGGAFDSAGGIPGADYICRWDGQAYHAVGNVSLNQRVTDMAFDSSGKLYIAGRFTNAGNDPSASYAAVLIGNQWRGLGAGLNNFADIVAISRSDEVVYSGWFTKAGGYDIDRLAIWANGSWRGVDFRLASAGAFMIRTFLFTRDDSLYMGGYLPGPKKYTCDQKIVTNGGNTNVYPTLEVKGPGDLKMITNYTTGKVIAFEGLILQTGEVITIDFNPLDIDMKSTWGGRGDLMKYINPGSDLGEFYLRPGDNYINLFMPTGTDINTLAFISFVPRFWNLEGSRYV